MSSSEDLRDEHILDLPDRLLDLLPAAVYVCDSDGTIVRFNRRAVELWGRTPQPAYPEQRFGASHRLYRIDGTPLSHAESPMAVVLRTGHPVTDQETVIERPDGSRIVARVSVEALKDDAGNIIGAINCFDDITGRRQAEEALREQTRRLDTLNRISRSISSELELERIVQTVTDSSTEMSGAKFGAFFYNVTEEGGERYVLYALSGASSEAFDKFGPPRNTAVFEPTFSGSGVVRSDDIRTDSRYGKNPPHFGMPKGHLPVVSYLAVPVISRSGEVHGGLFFGHDRPGVFTKEAEDVVAGIAAQAAIAIDNARLFQATQRLASIVESSDDAIMSNDLDGVITSWNGGAERLFGYSSKEVVGKPAAMLIPPGRYEEEAGILERIRQGVRPEPYETVRRRKDGSLADISLTVSPVRDGEGRVVGASKIARDISERKSAEEQRTMLIEELNHRVKNTLATVQSVANQTLKGNAPIAEERDAFEARLIALSNVHNLLTEGHWEGAALRGVVLGELAPYGAGESERITVDGPDVRLTPRAALALGMAVHELATNAAKYGALSNAAGRVRVAWEIGRTAGPGRLRLRWSESGGPAVKTPLRRGFGTRMIERGLSHDLEGEVRLLFEPGGVVCTMDMPFPEVASGA